jgi:hypothetical protein
MKIFKFRVRNYRSIVDLGDCYPADRVTVFAGMNEAGKSSVLEALEDFNAQRQIRDKALAIDGGTAEPEIEITFRLRRDELKSLLADISEEARAPDLSEEIDITIIKHYPDRYELSEQSASSLGFDRPPADRTDEIAAAHDRLIEPSQRVGYQLQPFSRNDLDGTLARAKKLKRLYTQHSGSLSEADRSDLQNLDQVIADLEAFPLLDESSASQFIGRFKAAMPNLILFSSFEDVFPNEIPFNELSSNRWIADLRMMSDLDVETIVGPNGTAKKTHKHHLNIFTE